MTGQIETMKRSGMPITVHAIAQNIQLLRKR
jgi:hypothetical protein